MLSWRRSSAVEVLKLLVGSLRIWTYTRLCGSPCSASLRVQVKSGISNRMSTTLLISVPGRVCVSFGDSCMELVSLATPFIVASEISMEHGDPYVSSACSRSTGYMELIKISWAPPGQGIYNVKLKRRVRDLANPTGKRSGLAENTATD